MNYVIEHWDDILGIYTAIVTIASIIVKIIPTLPEGSRWLPFVKWLARFVALNTKTPAIRPK